MARDDAINDPYIINNEFAEMQVIFEDALDEFLALLSEINIVNEDTLPLRIHGESATDIEPRTAKLPKLDLPSFSGNFEDWESFHDLFSSLVHNARISDSTKLQYLKSCLKGSAADLVKDVAITNANYASTWEALKSRFYNPRLTVNKHLVVLMNMPYLSRESAVELRAFADEAQRIVRALKNLRMPVEHWDVWFVYTIGNRLDADSRKIWESELSTKDREIVTNATGNIEGIDPIDRFPKFSDFADFLEKRAQALSMIAADKNTRKSDARNQTNSSERNLRKVFHVKSYQQNKNIYSKCRICAGPHNVFKCSKFLSKTPYERSVEVRRLHLCPNCLGAHQINRCNSNSTCFTCEGKHHTLLHFKTSIPSAPIDISNNSSDSRSASAKALTANISATSCSIVLATAQIVLIGPSGLETRARALLDQGSEIFFVFESIAQLLKLPKQRVEISLSGLGACNAGIARSSMTFAIQSTVDSEFYLNVNALVLNKLTTHSPARKITSLNKEELKSLPLADPEFYESHLIDIILGADVYGQLLRTGLQRFITSNLTAQNTVLGWILSGSLDTSTSRRADKFGKISKTVLHCAADEQLQNSLQRFWLLEEVPPLTNKFNPEENNCEKHFVETHARTPDGRFVVRLPFKLEPPHKGDESRNIALKSLVSIHKRFSRDKRLAESYRDFMTNYEHLGHMSRIPENEIKNPRAWYIPHHAVVDLLNENKKLRVVFDASRKLSDNDSLNKFLNTGPSLQQDLSLILLNWRKYEFVFTTDIVKMFRQILVDKSDQDFQRILWSPSSEGTPIEYHLETVTYGTTCAPFLAIRTLLQLAQDERSRYPLGARCLEYNTYVDDTFAGDNDLGIAIKKRNELVQFLGSAGITLDKWASNHNDLLPNNLHFDRTQCPKQIENNNNLVKALGVQWDPVGDCFKFQLKIEESLLSSPTKRTVLSTIARLFDPLGWLAPITVTAKIFMQDLWIQKCNWDSVLPIEMRSRWFDYCKSLSNLSELKINRWLGTVIDCNYELHGFSDASSRAYGAAIYLRIIDGSNNCRVSLLCAKTKVAPVKTISIPNLELCGTVLLVKTVCHLKELKFLRNLPVNVWSDSQIVLMWLPRHPSHWKIFVANRVSFLQTELPSAIWRHVPSADNLADIASRGCKAIDLANNKIWWHGPAWLSEPSEHWPQANEKPRVLHSYVQSQEPEILQRFSTLSRLIRVVAYCLRPLLRLRRQKENKPKLPNFLTASELADSRRILIRIVQENAFADEIAILKSGKALPKRHPLCKINPFYDKNSQLLRVGGRISNANVSQDHKHPAILPYRSFLILVSALNMENIINGRPASQAHFKYQVEVATKRNFSNQIYTLCGGGAIADDIVMSAASCVIDIIREERNESVLVIAGVDDLTNKGIEVFVYVIYLARYKRRAMQNDIALLKLIDGLGVGKNPRIALLALPSQPIVGFTGIVAGFGVNKADHQINPTKGYLEIVNGTTDFTLRYGKVEICTNKKCIEDHIEVDIANQICGIMIPFEEGETAGVCSGDGGSPLVIDDAVVGIVSTMQHSCNDTAKGAVYTRVTYFKQFIQKILQGIPPLYTEIYYNRPHVLEDLDSVF